tara:strand:+ start:422 stop:595 length:174 start_codon:yes stop_codon:yes gene_type:complete
MSFEKAKKDMRFWHAYHDNAEERSIYNDEPYTPEQFFEVWLDKDNYIEQSDDKRSEQ